MLWFELIRCRFVCFTVYKGFKIKILTATICSSPTRAAFMSAVSPEASGASTPAGGMSERTPPTSSGLPLSRARCATPTAALLSSSAVRAQRDQTGSIASSAL